MPQPSKIPPFGQLNAEYVESVYEQWKADPASVDESWQSFFQGFEFGLPFAPSEGSAAQGAEISANDASAQSRVASLIFAYRNSGHASADVNPLKDTPPLHQDLELSQFGFSEQDLDRLFDTGHLPVPDQLSLREILDVLQETYCGHIGVQYLHIQDVPIRRWLQAEMEPKRNKPDYDRDKRLEILSQLTDAEMFESFIQTRYPGQKRFSLEGAETLIPAVHALVEAAPEVGIKEMVIGMAHRGRLNILANILDKSYAGIFSEFEGNLLPDHFGGDGDVKYHKGFSSEHRNRYGRSVHLSLTANPSHLEAVNPVVLGRVRAKQRQHGDLDERTSILGLLIHGDAAFAGQGMVSETLNMSQLKGYRTGGTVHIIVNNQIGFTTDPTDSRSSAYCTDVAKAIDAPIFHVNGDDPEAVVYAVELALRFRQEFKRDVVIDMLCYRKHGHNEGDEPAFTQPLLYDKIRNHPSTRTAYTKRLVEEGVLDDAKAKEIAEHFQTQLQRHFEYARASHAELEVQAFDDLWQGLEAPYSSEPIKTAAEQETLLKVTRALTNVPDGFNLHRKIKRYLPEKMEAIEKGGMVDWSFGEALAFGTLLAEGSPVRLSGQDSERGTFSQRHAAWIDIKSGEKMLPLNNISEEQAHFCVYNSPLNEASVLGFEYGYSLAEPRMLVIWEAQFGDFVNGAQVIIDQFITSSQSKWQRTSGLVMLLPHGWEGQGPEHSNAYLERYLAACAQDNIQVCNLTTPAQYYHVLRRQIKRPFRRPLIIMAPKSMLRHKRAVSPVKELMEGSFQEIIDDDEMKVKDVRRVVLCSGKVYWDLLEKREEEEVKDVALLRVEQFYPLRNDLLTKYIGRYKNAEEILWVQEEPKNRGGWTHMRPVLQHLFPEHNLRYVGRGYAASPATGSLKRHQQEQATLVSEAVVGERSTTDTPVLPESIEKDEECEPSAA
ncbi:2-oxoglutarate dehydrogenase E1 component [bacterium]|nr:2-oxoglutarate dehydrogenase E1 component [bacterium]